MPVFDARLGPALGALERASGEDVALRAGRRQLVLADLDPHLMKRDLDVLAHLVALLGDDRDPAASDVRLLPVEQGAKARKL